MQQCPMRSCSSMKVGLIPSDFAYLRYLVNQLHLLSIQVERRFLKKAREPTMASNDVSVNQTTENAVQGLNTAIEGPKRAGRPRSKVACRECRRRKVRCDVYQRGVPCTNCHLDSSDCAVLKRRR